MNNYKLGLAIGDVHSGSLLGLNPPDFWPSRANHNYRNQKLLWEWFEREINRLKESHPIDFLICNGDLVDGPGKKSLGVEQITTDELEQIEGCKQILDFIGADKATFTFGTAYHTGQGCDFETILARHCGAEINGECNVSVEHPGGKHHTIMNLCHHTGRTSVPYGMNATEKSMMWRRLLSLDGRTLKSDILLRSHIHLFRAAVTRNYITMSLPALEYPGTKFGRRCDGDYDMGFMYFKFYEDGSYTWHPVLADLPGLKVPIVHL